MYTTNPAECFVVNDGNNAMTTAALLGNGGMGGGMWNNPIWALVFLAFLNNGGAFGFNGNNNCAQQQQLSAIQETLNTNQGNTMLMDAIRGNASSIHELATTLNCDINAVQTAINGVQSAISNLGARNDMNAMQIVNAINSGDMNIVNQLQSCCCGVKELVTTQGYENRLANQQQSQLIANGFSQVGYASAEQTCAIKQAIADQTIALSNKIDAQESARKDREINALTAALASANARAERQAELAPIYEAIKDVQSKQPNTITTQYQPFVAIPNCVAYNAGLYGLNGLNGAGVFG